METQEYIKREVDARAKAEADARSILDTAAEEKRDLSPEEEARFDAFVAESDKRKARIAKLTTMAEAAEVGESVRGIVGDATAQESTTASLDQQLAATIRGLFASHEQGGQTGEFVFDFPAGRAPFESRALVSSPDVFFPNDFSTRVAVYARTLAPWLGLATIVNGTGAPLILPRLTADPTTYTPGEGTAITASDPTISTVTATPTSYKALAYVSQEAAEDEVIQLMDLIARSQGRSIGLAFGSTVTTNVLTNATNGGTAAGTPFFDLDDLITLQYSAAAPYRVNGVWIMANGAISKVRKFKDSNGQYLWQPAVQLGQPDIFLGKAVYEDPALATPASVTKSVIFGDASALVIKQAPLRVAVSMDYAFNVDNVAIKTVYRGGDALPDALALRYLVSKTV